MKFKRAALAAGMIGLAAPVWAQGGGQTNPMYTFNQALSARNVTKSDTTVLVPTRALQISDATACDVAVIFLNDTSPITFTAQAGQILPFSVTKVMSANTTCTAVKALY